MLRFALIPLFARIYSYLLMLLFRVIFILLFARINSYLLMLLFRDNFIISAVSFSSSLFFFSFQPAPFDLFPVLIFPPDFTPFYLNVNCVIRVSLDVTRFVRHVASVWVIVLVILAVFVLLCLSSMLAISRQPLLFFNRHARFALVSYCFLFYFPCTCCTHDIYIYIYIYIYIVCTSN